jgi:hypothetical protein
MAWFHMDNISVTIQIQMSEIWGLLPIQGDNTDAMMNICASNFHETRILECFHVHIHKGVAFPGFEPDVRLHN